MTDMASLIYITYEEKTVYIDKYIHRFYLSRC